MFEPKSLKQAYTLATLHDNTLTHRRYSSNPNKQTYHPTTYAYQDLLIKVIKYSTLVSYQPLHLITQTMLIEPLDLLEIVTCMREEIRVLCFGVMKNSYLSTGVRRRSFTPYVLLKKTGREDRVTKLDHDTHNPHISLNALEGVIDLNAFRVIARVEKQPLFILVDFGSTHNSINNQVTDMLHCKITSIKALIVQVVDGGTMTCISVCNNFQWLIHGVNFTTNVFTLDLKNYDMILGIQWLAKLKTIVCNYKEIWMAFMWQGQEVFIKGDEPISVETIRFEQLNGLLCSTRLVYEINLCSLRLIEGQDHEGQPISTRLRPCVTKNDALTVLQEEYREVFEEPRSLPPPRSHNHNIPLKEGSNPINLGPYRHSSI